MNLQEAKTVGELCTALAIPYRIESEKIEYVEHWAHREQAGEFKWSELNFIVFIDTTLKFEYFESAMAYIDNRKVSNVIPSFIDQNPIMDINSKPGTKVVFLYPNNGYPQDKKYVKQHLEEGQTYTVKHVRSSQSISYVELEEVPGKTFNTVHFSPVVVLEAK